MESFSSQNILWRHWSSKFSISVDINTNELNKHFAVFKEIAFSFYHWHKQRKKTTFLSSSPIFGSTDDVVTTDSWR
jgi:hypothetical protein